MCVNKLMNEIIISTSAWNILRLPTPACRNSRIYGYTAGTGQCLVCLLLKSEL